MYIIVRLLVAFHITGFPCHKEQSGSFCDIRVCNERSWIIMLAYIIFFKRAHALYDVNYFPILA